MTAIALDIRRLKKQFGQSEIIRGIDLQVKQGERMAVLMEQLSKESDPEVRRKIMAEAMCPQ